MAIRKFRIKIDEKVFEAEVEEIEKEKQPDNINKGINRNTVVTKDKPNISPQNSSAGIAIVAPMPGKIVAINVAQ